MYNRRWLPSDERNTLSRRLTRRAQCLFPVFLSRPQPAGVSRCVFCPDRRRVIGVLSSMRLARKLAFYWAEVRTLCRVIEAEFMSRDVYVWRTPPPAVEIIDTVESAGEEQALPVGNQQPREGSTRECEAVCGCTVK
ncbi:hypothetical protein MHYP_G00025410 [Metynnis hypsauchen]